MNNYKHLSNSKVIVRKLVPTKTIKKKTDAFYKLALYAFILAWDILFSKSIFGSFVLEANRRLYQTLSINKVFENGPVKAAE